MVIPNVEFRYSKIYLEQLLSKKINAELDSELKSFEGRYAGYWKINGVKILESLQTISGLKWHEHNITCYIVGKHRAFSDPLSIPAYPNENIFIDIMVHELSHRLLVQNKEKLYLFWKYIREKYNKESKLTLNHVPVFAMQTKIYLDLFDQEKLSKVKNIKPSTYSPDYMAAWHIVDSEGYNNILKEMRDSSIV